MLNMLSLGLIINDAHGALGFSTVEAIELVFPLIMLHALTIPIIVFLEILH